MYYKHLQESLIYKIHSSVLDALSRLTNMLTDIKHSGIYFRKEMMSKNLERSLASTLKTLNFSKRKKHCFTDKFIDPLKKTK